jgi:hypothetical protein
MARHLARGLLTDAAAPFGYNANVPAKAPIEITGSFGHCLIERSLIRA